MMSEKPSIDLFFARFELLSRDNTYSLYRDKFYVWALDCVRYNGDFVIPGFVVSGGFCSIHFVVTLAGLKNIVRFTGTSLNDLISGFHCTMKVIFSRFGRYSVSINQLN